MPDSQYPLPSCLSLLAGIKKSRSKLLQALVHAFVLIMGGKKARYKKKPLYPLQARGVTLSIQFYAAISPA